MQYIMEPSRLNEYPIGMTKLEILRHTPNRSSASRIFEGSVKFAEAAHRQGVRILSITDEWISPIGKLSEIVLSVKGRPFAMLETQVPALALCEALLISVTNRLPDTIKQRMELIEYLSAEGRPETSDYSC